MALLLGGSGSEETQCRIVTANDIAVLRSRRREQLILQTCHPRFSATHRYLVFALPKGRATVPQVKFRLNYRGFGFNGGGCAPYTGPALPWLVTACDGPDGSFWAAQSFPQPLPDLGYTPWTSAQSMRWLELSHWTGPAPQLTVGQDSVYGGRFREVYGRLMYLGLPVYGLHTTRYGVPTGGYGSLVYLDVLDAPAYGPGWRRENSFVTHKGSGGFCYGFYRFDPTKGGYRIPPGATARRGPGVATEYRITAHRPGVAPDVGWTGAALGPYDRSSPQTGNSSRSRSRRS
jgi:hypothetical protein